MSLRLVVISPCRDESRFVEWTLRSVVEQTKRPDRWIVVDDGSTDSTPDIVRRYASIHPWIEIVKREDRGERRLGPGVVAAFNEGLRCLGSDSFDVISKLDCDMEFGSDCFERILHHFEDPKVGMASGTTYLKVGEKLVSERHAPYYVPGQAKFYRRECFRDIGGLQSVYGWDILDQADARRHGWITLHDPEIRLIHHRLQGSSFGPLRGRVIWGYGAYATGTHPLFAFWRGIYRMVERPRLIGGLAFLWGFFSNYLAPRVARTENAELIRYLRREQLYRLFHMNRLPPGKGGNP